MAHGRLEGRITFSANQTGTVTDSNGGPTAWTLTAGSYYPTDLAAAFQASLVAATGSVGDNFTVTISRGESGATGRCTITTSDVNWSLVFTTSDLRDALGFTGNISNASSAQTGTNHVKPMWIPNGPSKYSPYGDTAAGDLITDYRATKGPGGHVHALFGNEHRAHRNIMWNGVTGARTHAHLESVTGESFESFYRDCALGRVSYIPVNTYVRLIWDADTDGTYAVGRILWPTVFQELTEAMEYGWTGKWRIRLPELAVEAS